MCEKEIGPNDRFGSSLTAIAAAGAPFVPGSNTAAHPAASARTKIILDRDHRPGARVSSGGCSAKTG